MELYLKQIPTPKPEQRIILAGDHTPWPRTEAPTLKDRTYEHGAKVISGKPITLGHGYSTLAWIPEGGGATPSEGENENKNENFSLVGKESRVESPPSPNITCRTSILYLRWSSRALL